MTRRSGAAAGAIAMANWIPRGMGGVRTSGVIGDRTRSSESERKRLSRAGLSALTSLI